MRNPDIAAVADRILTKAKVTAPPVPVLAIAKSHGIVVRFGPLPDDLSGFLVREDERTVIGVNSRQAKPRQMFTLAHELGHFFLHPSSNFVDRKFIYFRDPRSSKAVDIKEMQANEFAAELLMPERLIRGYLKDRAVDLEDDESLANLARQFEVSSQALTFRLLNLNLANQVNHITPTKRVRKRELHDA
jgi:Zn-dependent peptidase ImmA (M78 family)